jgi:hypothetical protein
MSQFRSALLARLPAAATREVVGAPPPATTLVSLHACQCTCGCGVQLGRSLFVCVACRSGGHARPIVCEPASDRAA